MKKAFGVSLIALWVLLATALLARLLLIHLRIQEDLPKSFWLWLGDVFGVHNSESLESQMDLEILLGYCFSLIVVSVLTLAGWLLWRRIKAR